MPVSKRHHYTPRYYLKRFENAEGAMWRLDVESGAIVLGNNERFGYKNNWNTLRNPPSGYAPDWAEQRIAEIDGLASAEITRILAGDFSTDLRAVACAIALMTHNNPRVMRDLDEHHADQVAHWSEDYRLVVKLKTVLDTWKDYVPLYYAVQVIDEGAPDAQSNPIAWIGAQIDAAGADYAGAKRAIADTVGFEDGHGKVNVEVELDDPDDFLNLQLGLKDGLRFTRFTYTSERFGVPAGKAEIDGEGGTLHITPTPRQGVLRLSTTAGDELILNAKVVSADEPGEPGRWRTRIIAGCFDMIIGKGATRASATLKDDERHTLEHIGSFTTLLRWHDKGTVDIRLLLDGNMLELGTIDLSSSRLRGWDNIALGADVLRAVAKAALRDDVLLSVQEIHAAAPDLDLMSALASDRVLKIEFTPQPGAPERFTGMLAYTGADVGEWACLAIVYRPVADDIRDGEKRSLIFQPGRIVEARMVPGRSVDHIEEFARKYGIALDRLSETGEMLDVGEFRRFVRRQAA